MPCFPIVSDLKLRKFFGKIRTTFGEINSQLHRRRLFIESARKYVQKISRQHYCSLISKKGIWFSTHRKDGANTASMCSQRNCYCCNDALQKHESNGLLSRWWHWRLWHCHWGLARRYSNAMYVYNLPKFRTSKFNRSNWRKLFYI